jgi:biotin carboxylase
VLLLVHSQTYRAADFVIAARRVGVDLVVASDHRQAWDRESIVVDFAQPGAAADTLLDAVRDRPVQAVVAVDDPGVVIAADVSGRLGLPGNPLTAAAATRDKLRMRETLAAAGVPQPVFAAATTDDDAGAVAAAVGFPVVLKPLDLSASRGVIRADDAGAARAAAARIRALAGDDAVLLVEAFVPGTEVAVEGMVRGGILEVLAVFDKPDPLDGPYFTETLYVTPSRHAPAALDAVTGAVAGAITAIGLRDGPVHAEARITADGHAVMLEVAARTIGGLCSRTLQFGLGISLEELVLRHALGRPLGNLDRVAPASGVLMLPVPHRGVLRAVTGVDAARAVPGVAGVEITAVPGTEVLPLPEGDRYLGFVFAHGPDPATVEAALRQAWAELRVDIAA